MSTTKNLNLDQGADFSFSLTATNATGTALSITSGSGYTASGQFRKSYASSNYTVFGANITGATGNISCAIGATNTAAVRYGKYVYDVVLSCPDGKTIRQQEGLLFINPQVTR